MSPGLLLPRTGLAPVRARRLLRVSTHQGVTGCSARRPYPPPPRAPSPPLVDALVVRGGLSGPSGALYMGFLPAMAGKGPPVVHVVHFGWTVLYNQVLVKIPGESGWWCVWCVCLYKLDTYTHTPPGPRGTTILSGAGNDISSIVPWGRAVESGTTVQHARKTGTFACNGAENLLYKTGSWAVQLVQNCSRCTRVGPPRPS